MKILIKAVMLLHLKCANPIASQCDNGWWKARGGGGWGPWDHKSPREGAAAKPGGRRHQLDAAPALLSLSTSAEGSFSALAFPRQPKSPFGSEFLVDSQTRLLIALRQTLHGSERFFFNRVGESMLGSIKI